MRDNAARLIFKIVDQFLVLYFKHDPSRQHLPPMLHQSLIRSNVTAKLCQVISELVALGEHNREARQCRIPPIAEGVNNPRIWKREMDKADILEVVQHLVDDSLRGGDAG